MEILSRFFEIKHRERFIPRLLFYILGNIILAFGVTFNTKTAFGASPFIALAFTTAEISGVNLGVTSFLTYLTCIFLQFVILRKDFKPEMLLQILLSFLTSFFIGIFDTFLPDLTTMGARVIGLAVGISCTGIGSSIIVDMKLIANPADSLANLIGIKLKRGFGFGKNVFDFAFLATTAVIGLVCRGRILGIGIGTVCAMIFTGRVIALFQKLFKEKTEYFI